jgi:hypothetical protein
MLVALGGVVVDHVEQHLQPGRMQRAHIAWNSATSPPGRPARAAAEYASFGAK